KILLNQLTASNITKSILNIEFLLHFGYFIDDWINLKILEIIVREKSEEDISFNNLSYTNYNLKILRIKTATRRSFTSSIIDFIRTFHMVRSIDLIYFSIPDCQIDVLKEIFISRNDDLILNLVDCKPFSPVLVDLICITCKNKFVKSSMCYIK
ncbi:hypothetical protein CWI37_2833p0010, partial [Hamiltosporidium tvaerminnensis]